MAAAAAAAVVKSLPPVERYMLDKAVDMGFSSDEFFEAEIKDSKHKCHLNSTEIKADYPATFQCANHWPVCLNKVTAHQAAYCEQFGPASFGVRCQQHLDMAEIVRPASGGILQQAKWGKRPDHVPVKLSEVTAMMAGFVQAIPTYDENKKRLIQVRVDDALLAAMWLEVTLVGRLQEATKKWEWHAEELKGRLATGRRNDAAFCATAESDPLVLKLFAEGTMITVQLARVVDLLYTMRLGF